MNCRSSKIRVVGAASEIGVESDRLFTMDIVGIHIGSAIGEPDSTIGEHRRLASVHVGRMRITPRQP